MKLLESFFISLNSLSTAAEREGQRGGKVGQPARGYLHTDGPELISDETSSSKYLLQMKSLVSEAQWTLTITLFVGQRREGGQISLGRRNLKTQSGFGLRKRGRERCDGVKWEEGLLLSRFGEGCLAKHEGGRRGRKTGKEILYLA